MQIDLEILDEVSRDFASYAAEHRANWLAHARPLPVEEHSDVHYLEFVFPNPPGTEGQEPLWVSTFGGEVTIGMDAHHAHFPWPEDYNGEDGRPAAMNHIYALMREEKVIVSIWEQGQARASSWGLPQELSRYQECPKGPMELRIRSWCGRYNRTLRFDWDNYLRIIRGTAA